MFKKTALLFSIVLVLVSVAVCIEFVDRPVALFFKSLLLTNLHDSKLPTIPDMLAIITVLVVGVSWFFYFFMTSRGIQAPSRAFYRFLGFAALIGYGVKTLLQYTFGRVGTRYWLANPDSYVFTFFSTNGDFTCFPSGHMIVFTAMFLTLWYFYPRMRFLVVGALLSLAFALVASDYHFLSDVIAGFFTGYLVHLFSYYLHNRWKSRQQKVANVIQVQKEAVTADE